MLVTQSCLTVCDLVDCSRPGSSVHAILQARILEWVVIPFSKERARQVAKIRQAGEEDSGFCPGPKDRNAETYIYGEADGPGFCHTESSQKEIHVSYVNGYMWNLEKFV